MEESGRRLQQRAAEDRNSRDSDRPRRNSIHHEYASSSSNLGSSNGANSEGAGSVVDRSVGTDQTNIQISPTKKRIRGNDGDRFIPTRGSSSSELWTSFSAFDPPQTPGKRRTSLADTNFTNLLHSELFGDSDASPSSVAMAKTPSTSNLNSSMANYDTGPGPATLQTPPSSTFSSSSSALQTTPITPSRKVFQFMSPRERNNSPYKRKLLFQDDPNRTKYSLSPVRSLTRDFVAAGQQEKRKLPTLPYKVLDAPNLADDYYLNLLDWGQCNVLAIALGSRVYLWSPVTSEVKVMHNFWPSDTVTSLKWVQRGTHLAVGTNNGMVEIWDAEACKKTRTMAGHSLRVGALAWNDHVLSSGGRDNTILHRDVRESEHYFRTLRSHRQEICNLDWSSSDNQLASGGNDNALYVWDKFSDVPLYSFHNHVAAVRALSWSTHQRGILASGGGTADQTIKIWNTHRGSMLHDINTGSQVCSLQWSKLTNEIVSTHGFVENEIAIWNYPKISRVGTLKGHTNRVLFLSMSPDGENVVTGAADETLRFWKLFDSKANMSYRGSPFDPIMKIR
ncbi:CDK inhibitor Srw1 [Schizosaccharomyces cryophilus OY26]|uniref:CDK inhibitor Srw1 n=1 Tax=Schizosaccharomyces cryophilus (strain OY26 / ATCC MYA-4695 / CBS 11777 / NBRC 106824 / NRRL Y48691) TaxID=653667 RepID=S9X028_SCHCR|nr:CDK inhibitor Srw1 [Schizosaccharomyces cryophilus OY26]EPY50307.1 CDK inhibitor Srw1 [Schizosaccharomyces cryophilus OY26]